MAMVRKKQDDKYLEALRELITTGGGNRQCFDCGQKGPTYVNMTIGSFVCTRCSGVLRGITPPHRVKSISMATFTQDEIDYLKAHGNDVCAKTWLGLWDPKRAVHQDQRELMIDKYERKRYYLEPASPLKSLTNATNLKTTTAATTSSTSSTSAIATASASLGNNSQNNNSKTQIQLTPPTSQRTTANGLHKTSSTAISRPQHITPQSQNGFSSSLSSHNTDAFGLHNGLNSSVGSMSTGALSDTSSCASANGFGAEADFVADFGSADIFNATVASSPASSIGSSKTNNGYAKIQPMKISAAAHQQFLNGHGNGSVGNNMTTLQNGNLVNGTNGNTENFADFDHAPIYNAAVEETPNYQFVRKNAIRKKSTSSVSGSIIRRNERQLKDILEMDNNENAKDYINFNDDDAFAETTINQRRNATQSGGYSNLFDDFDALLTMDDNNRKKTNFKEFESDYANVNLDHHIVNGSSSKFTPLALAAHATAMAVLGNQSHFNSKLQTAEHNRTNKIFTNEWDAWPSSKDMATTTTTTTRSSTNAASNIWFPNSHCNEAPQKQQQQHHQYQQLQLQQQQKQLQLYASIVNFNTQLEHSQQYFPSSTLSSQSLSQFDTGKTTLPTAPTTVATITPTTTTTTSMLNKNTINTTNPFRMHLDVNDNNYNTINYDNDYYYFDNYNTANITPTTTITTTTGNTDFNINNSNFDFVTNSILSYDFDIFSTATTPLPTNTYPSFSSSIATTTTTATPLSLSTQNYYSNNDNNCYLNSKINSNDHDVNEAEEEDVVKDIQIIKNPFLTSLKNSETQKEHLNAQQFFNNQHTYPKTSTTTSYSTANSIVPCTLTTERNPFRSAPSSDHTTRTFCHTVTVGDDNTNINIQNIRKCNENNNKHNHNYNLNYDYDSNYNNDNNIDDGRDVANNFHPKTNHNYLNSNCNFKSYFNTNRNANQNPNSCLNENENYNFDNNSWRLPNSNKSSITNGFNNNNSNNMVNNNNSSAPAEDRYAALKDLDEQLRESKAVAAQAASIVTANVVDSGFGNPNVNGTVNPFATHHHNHQQAVVVNPFQNAANNATQNATQQLFGQMTLIPNGIAAANGFLNAQKTHNVNTGFFNYTASGFTIANTPQIQQQQQQHQQQHQTSLLYPTSVQTGPNGCGFGFGTLQQQIASTGTGLTTNSFNNPFAATGALNSNNPFL